MSEQNYLSLVQLAKSLNKKAQMLEKGKLAFEEVNEMLENSRDIYERLTVIRYKALVEKKELLEGLEEEIITKEKIDEVVEESSFSFQFDTEEEDSLVISPNQKNLLDEINEIGSDPIFEFPEIEKIQETKEVEESHSINQNYASSQQPESLGEKLTKSKIKDLREAIALNQKFLFMNELFEGDKGKYDKVLDKINGCETLIEAKAFLSSEVDTYSSWDEETQAVQQFNSLIERKFL